MKIAGNQEQKQPFDAAPVLVFEMWAITRCSPRLQVATGAGGSWDSGQSAPYAPNQGLSMCAALDRQRTLKERRACWYSTGMAVEVWDDLSLFVDEPYVIGERLGNFCWDAQVGKTCYILAWGPELGHDGLQYLLHVQEEGDTLHIANPFDGIMLLDGALAARTNQQPLQLNSRFLWPALIAGEGERICEPFPYGKGPQIRSLSTTIA